MSQQRGRRPGKSQFRNDQEGNRELRDGSITALEKGRLDGVVTKELRLNKLSVLVSAFR